MNYVTFGIKNGRCEKCCHLGFDFETFGECLQHVKKRHPRVRVFEVRETDKLPGDVGVNDRILRVFCRSAGEGWTHV